MIQIKELLIIPMASVMIYCVLFGPALAAEDTEEIDYILQIDWSDSFNYHSPDMVSHCYHIHSKKSTRWNNKRMYNPAYYGLPDDIVFSRGPGILEWTYIYSYGMKYAVRHNGQMYTNDSNAVDYIIGYLPKPEQSLSNNYVDNVYRTDVDYTFINNDITLSTKITCDWHHTTRHSRTVCTIFGCRTYTWTSKEYHHNSVNIADKIENVELWPAVKKEGINITITNHSGKYTTVSFNIPDNTTNIEINLDSNNHTATYKKYYYYYIKNDSGFYDMFDCNIVFRSDMAPYGSGCYLLPYQPDYNVTACVFTPFDKYDLNMTIIRTDIIETEPEEHDIQLLGSLLSVFLSLIVLYRGLS